MSSGISAGPIGYTGFVHPSVKTTVARSSIGGASLIEALVVLHGDRADIGVACNLQDNDRLLDFERGGRRVAGDLVLGDGSFTEHGVTFIGKVHVGQGCGTVINAVVQNATIGD